MKLYRVTFRTILLASVVVPANLLDAPASAATYHVTDLGTLGGTESAAWAINGKGQVTGWSKTSSNGPSHAILYSGGSMSDLGTLGGSYSEGRAINNSGQVVGQSYVAGNSSYHACLWSGGGMTDLAPQGGNSSATDINNLGHVVGWANNSGNTSGIKTSPFRNPLPGKS